MTFFPVGDVHAGFQLRLCSAPTVPKTGGTLMRWTHPFDFASARTGGEAVNLLERAKQLKVDIPAVFIAMKKEKTPLLAKILAGVTVAYALSPIDFIPDFIPVVGLLDDVILLPGLIALVIKLIPADVLAECRDEAVDLWKDGKPKKWYYALPIAAVWLALIYLIIKLVWLKGSL